jgi:hypothetical protein
LAYLATLPTSTTRDAMKAALDAVYMSKKTSPHLVLPISKSHYVKFDVETSTFFGNKNGSGGVHEWQYANYTVALKYLATLPTSPTRDAMKAALDAVYMSKSNEKSNLVLPINKSHYVKFDVETSTFFGNMNGSGGVHEWTDGNYTVALEYLATLPTSPTKNAMKAALDAVYMSNVPRRKQVKTSKQIQKEMVSKFSISLTIL